MSNHIAMRIILERIKKEYDGEVTITKSFGRMAFCARNKIFFVEPAIRNIGDLDVDGWVKVFKRSKIVDQFEIHCDLLESQTGDFVCECVDEEDGTLDIDALETMVWEHSRDMKIPEVMRRRVCKEVVKRHLS